jgi:ribulose bisphosphate carboxylase small subunit
MDVRKNKREERVVAFIVEKSDGEEGSGPISDDNKLF